MKNVLNGRMGRNALALALAACTLAACDAKPDPSATGAAPAAAEALATTAPAAAPAPATGPASTEPGRTGFDLDQVPVSEVPLGAFPYFEMPAGYQTSKLDTRSFDYDRFPFWTGDRFEWVEGKIRSGSFRAESGRSFSALEAVRNFEHLLAAMGGVKLPVAGIPKPAWDEFNTAAVRNHFRGAVCYPKDPVNTFVVRRSDRTIWVQLCTMSSQGGLVIAETAPFQATATLLPADALQQRLDEVGKVALQVNFATNRAEILPESRPQIDQVLRLLERAPALRLSINGHTDASGDAARNLALSEARAQAVVSALTKAGVDASRLQARGFGQGEPVADNVTEEGKARNRRVELVRQ